MFARTVRLRLLDNPMPKAAQAFVADRLFIQRHGVGHLSQRPSILLGPLGAHDAFRVGACHWALILRFSLAVVQVGRIGVSCATHESCDPKRLNRQ